MPVPEEVIPIQKLVEKIESQTRTAETRKVAQNNDDNDEDGELLPGLPLNSVGETSGLLSGVPAQGSSESASYTQKSLSRASKSLVHVDQDHVNGLLAAKSESKITSGRNRKLLSVDASFSPFRRTDQRNGSDPLNLPKMTIFLPKHSESSDEESSTDEEKENSPLKNPSAAV